MANLLLAANHLEDHVRRPSLGLGTVLMEEQAIMGTSEQEARREPVLKFAHATGDKPLQGFTIKRGVGVGGFGEVYFAVSDAGKEVALKRIQRNLDIELRGVSHCLNLKHPNLVSLYDVRFDDAGEAWVVMEYVTGESLRDALDRHPDGMPMDEIRHWFVGTSAGVEYLHNHGIVHRDLKPGNIFSDEDLIKVGDYGLSKYISCSRRSGQTESVGTFHYMAPEIGKGNYGKEIDVYALGVILYEMLTGNAPFDGESSQEIIMKHLTADPDLTLVPATFRPIITKALAKDASQRFASVGDMRLALEVALGGGQPQVDAPAGRPVGQTAEASVDPSVAAFSASSAAAAQTNTSQDNQPQDDLHFIGDDEHAAESEDEIFLAETSVGRRAPSAPKAPSRPEPIFIQDEPPAMTFGPVQQSSPGGGRRVVSAAGAGIAVAASNQVRNGAPAGRPTGPMANEPIARAVQGGWENFSQWWAQGSTSTLLKVLIVCCVLALVFLNADWLLPAAIFFGVVYLAYFGVRAAIVAANGDPESRAARRRTNLNRQETLQASLEDKTLSEKSVELTGSLLGSTLVMGVLAVLMLVISGRGLDDSVYTWNLGAWLAITGLAAVWSVLAAGKFWEGKKGEGVIRRFVMLAIGVAVGGFSFAISRILMVGSELTYTAHSSNRTLFDSFVGSGGESLLPAFLAFFAGLFLILRWWKQADPLRHTRLSLWAIGLAMLWGWVVGEFTFFPQPWSLLLAGSIAITVQLVSPWLSQTERSQIRQAYLNDHGRLGELS